MARRRRNPRGLKKKGEPQESLPTSDPDFMADQGLDSEASDVEEQDPALPTQNPRNGSKKRRKQQESPQTSDPDFVADEESDSSASDDEAPDPALPLFPLGSQNLRNGNNHEVLQEEVQPLLDPEYNIRRNAKKPKKSVPRNEKKKIKETEGMLWELWENENEKWVEERETLEFPEADAETAPIAETESQPPEILLPLLRFQKEWLSWALKQESEISGGILADEMGMGKTIQAISLVLAARSRSRHHPPLATSSPTPSSSSSLPTTRCTLVICPVVAMIQWADEIKRNTARGSVRVLHYHGPKRDKTLYNFDDYDFVLTTYSTLEYDYRKFVMPPKDKCKYCGKLFYPKRMQIHLNYYCGPNAQKTEKQSKQVKKWKLDGSCPKKVHSEDKKENDKASTSSRNSTLHSIKWERIILDEAHFIKDRCSNTSKAVFSLESLYKWALSGTPLQNRIGELYSLIKFLQVWPYSFCFCKDCNCWIADRSTNSCANCPHAISRHFVWWNRYIIKEMHSGNEVLYRRAMLLLREKVLKRMVLRRTKKGRAADLALPPRIVTLRRDSLDKNEQEFYEALYTQSCVEFDTFVESGTLLNNYAHVFDLLTRLRQAVDHPYLVVYPKSVKVLVASQDGTMKDDCGICYETAEDIVVTSCEHVFCKACLSDYSANLGNVSCPSCSKPLTADFVTKNSSNKISRTIKDYKQSGILKRLQLSNFKTSTKIDALREEIRDMVEHDGAAKGIVFSQFTSFLDLIHYSLEMSGVKCVRLVGSMSLADREKAINTFINDADCKIFLMSLKAGGVALNLTVASNVFLMDPWWNPAVERQAQDRIHRIGQYKPIRIVRFVIENTIEERILKLQEKKQNMFDGTLGDSPEAMAKLSAEDLRFLFNK